MSLFQAEKQLLEQNLQKTEENLSRQLTYAQQVSPEGFGVADHHNG